MKIWILAFCHNLRVWKMVRQNSHR